MIVYLGLGSSVGNKKQVLLDACVEIKKWGHSFQCSSFVYSAPWGGVAKNEFVNAVCSIVVDESVSPEILLKKIHLLEKKFQRTRNIKWEDRTLDVDILLYGQKKISTEILTIPHFYILDRSFVYEPLLELMKELKSKKELKKYIEKISNNVG